MPIKFTYDKNLRAKPEDESVLIRELERCQRKVEASAELGNFEQAVRGLGELGVYLRILGVLNAAARCLERAFELVETHNLSASARVQQTIRYGHVLQFQEKFEQSNALFERVISECRSSGDLDSYLPFALQHSGKNQFDQGNYGEALRLFSEALAIRKKSGAPVDQIESSQFAIDTVKERLRLNSGSDSVFSCERKHEFELGVEERGHIQRLLNVAFPGFFTSRAYFKQVPTFRLLARAVDKDRDLLAQVGVVHRVMSLGGVAFSVFGVMDLAVAAHARGQGIGSQLLCHVEQLAYEFGIQVLVLFADDHRLYKHLGFELKPNPCKWVKIDEHETLGIGLEPMVDCLMVKLLDPDLKWDDEAELDLLGFMY